MYERVLGLDVGSRTVGVAVSDPLGWTAQGLEVIPIAETEGDLGLKRLGELLSQYAIKRVVIGLPKNMNNSLGFRAEASQAYGAAVQENFSVEVIYQDERLTTMQAERFLIEEGNVSRQKRRQVIDKLAAVFILQTYLDQQSKGETHGNNE